MSATLPLTENEMVQHAILFRTELLRHLIDPKRDIDKECGYPTNPTIQDYRFMYDREGIATRVVDIFPEESWKVSPEVLETPEGEETPWEKVWRELVEEHNLYAQLKNVDAVSGIGHFGILLLGIDDGKALNDPVDEVVDAYRTATPKTKEGPQPGATAVPAPRKLMYVQAFDESVTTIKAYDTDRRSRRYGQPLSYQVNMASDTNRPSGQSPTEGTLDIHWSRVIHVADNCRNSRVFGTPRMKDVFNRLYDLRKILGGSGEMFWKGGFPGLSLEAGAGTGNTPMPALTKEDKEDLRAQMDLYQNGLQRWLALVGMQAKSLAPQVADPSAHVTTQIKAICGAKGFPYRIFLGSEEAQLAGEQDKLAWNGRLAKRQAEYLSPSLVRPLVDRLVLMRVIVAPKGQVVVQWPDLYNPSPKERAETASKQVETMSKYISGQVDALMQPMDLLTYVLGYTTQQAEAILEKASLDEEGRVQAATEEDRAKEEERMEMERQAMEAKTKATPPTKKPGK